MKLSRLRKPKAACFLSFVEHRPNTNTSNIRKTGYAKGRSHTRRKLRS
jgi:hypothetical protein